MKLTLKMVIIKEKNYLSWELKIKNQTIEEKVLVLKFGVNITCLIKGSGSIKL